MKLAILLTACLFCTVYGQQEGSIGLFRNGVYDISYTSGIVQVYSNNTWAGICNTASFGKSEADVICHQLGYTDASTYEVATSTSYGSVSLATYTDVSCDRADYQVLFQCEYGQDGCNADMAVSVECLSTRLTDDPYSGQVRLTGGTYTNEGTIEIYCNDGWGTVCNNNFGNSAETVVCNQLGYNNVVDTTGVSRNASLPVWLSDDVTCGFFDTCLSSCQSCPVSDVATSCTGNGYVVSIECSYEPESSPNTRTVGTCDFTELAEAISRLIGIIVGVVIACCVISILLAILPFCICCCLGVGIGAAASKA